MCPPRSYVLYSNFKPSAPAAEEEMKLPPPLHLAYGDPNGLRGNIRLVNSKTRSPAGTLVSAVYCRHCATGT